MGPVGGYQVNVVMVQSPVVPNKIVNLPPLPAWSNPFEPKGARRQPNRFSALRHDTPSALTGDLTNRTGHDLQLGIDPYPWFLTVLTDRRLGDQRPPNQQLPVEGSLIDSH